MADNLLTSLSLLVNVDNKVILTENEREYFYGRDNIDTLFG